MSHTPGPWVWGSWKIFPEDRQAQKEGKPYWTLCEEEPDTLAQGPFGRKSFHPESIIETEGYECDGISANEFDAPLLAAAPELLAALKAVQEFMIPGMNWIGHELIEMVDKAIAKASPPPEAAQDRP